MDILIVCNIFWHGFWCHKAICVKVIFVVYDNEFLFFPFFLFHDFTENNIVYNTDFIRLIKERGKGARWRSECESRQYFYIFMYSNEQPQNNIVSWWNCRMLFKHILLFSFPLIITSSHERIEWKGRKYGRDAKCWRKLELNRNVYDLWIPLSLLLLF